MAASAGGVLYVFGGQGLSFFGGAFVARIVAGDDIEQAGHYAAAAAALSTEGYGAVTPIPTADKVRALLERRRG